MTNQNGRNFTWLNREGRWEGAFLDGLEIGPGGELRLRAVPLVDGVPAPEIAALPAPDGPAGIAVDRDGSVYFSDPQGNRVLRIDGCDRAIASVPCLGGLKTPRGLLLEPQRGALFIVESGAGEIRAVRAATGQSLEIWQPFATPWMLAEDDAGNVYVVDYGNRSVQQFNALGELQASFWKTLAAAKVLTQPSDVATGQDRVFIADRASHSIAVVDRNGNPLAQFGAGQLQQPMGMAVVGNVLYVGDNGRRRLLAFDAMSGNYIGEAARYQGPVAALAPDGAGGLLVHTGSALAPVRLLLDRGYVKQGVFWTAAIEAPPDASAGKVVWHRLEAVLDAFADALPPDTHLQFFLYTSNNAADAPAPPVLDAGGAMPFTDKKWRAQPPDVNDVYIGGAATLYIWVGAWLSGGGDATPSIEQIRVDFDHQTYLANLPAIYQKPGACQDFLLRLLSLFESFNSENEAAIGRLPSLFDPQAAPVDYLPWLAGWLALRLEEGWDEATARRAIAQAFRRYAQRGTAVGLRNALKEDAGVDAVIQEPILHAAWWSLPVPQGTGCNGAGGGETVWQAGENSVLGYTTMLAPAQPQGAVVGASAVLDQSHLLAETDFGAPLFEDVAFQFSVQVYRGQLNCAAAEDRVRTVIESEKPAHTIYHLCVLEPRMRVGFQARVGIDTIVGGPPAGIRLGETPELGVGTALGGQPAGRIGAQLQLGVTTLVG
ncbi:MAG: phage tail protein [Bryobacteraceae bacterium]